MYLKKTAILFLAMVLTAFAMKIAAQDIPVKGYSLFWHDEFNGRELDASKWAHRAVGQKRGEAYLSDRVAKLDGKGMLVIEARRSNDSLLTGMIATEGIFETAYGYFECRASLTKAKGVFPAFWLQSRLNNRDGATPESNGAEIDIFEYFRHANAYAVAHTLHWGGYGATHKVAGPVWGTLKSTPDGFHTFGLEWTPEGYTTYVDGVQTYQGSTLVSQVPEFMVLSLGIDQQAAGPLDQNALPERFMVDYVRIYKKDQ